MTLTPRRPVDDFEESRRAILELRRMRRWLRRDDKGRLVSLPRRRTVDGRIVKS